MQKHREILALALAGGLAVTLMSPAAAVTSVEDDSTGHRYDLVRGSPTWVEAEAAARTMSWGEDGVCTGYLASITSRRENNFIVGAFGATALRFTWLGGIQPRPDDGADGWTWANGEDWGYTNWFPGEPNNIATAGHDREDATVFLDHGLWNDAARTWWYPEGGYLVEYDCLGVSVDVRPGSADYTVSRNNRGVIPVAILTTDSFDAATVDPTTVTLNGAAAQVRGSSGTAGALEDVDGDGDLDLVVHIVKADDVFVDGSTTATVLAETFGGTPLKGLDSITYVP